MRLMIRSFEAPTGIELPYVEQGYPSGLPTILLHGFTDSSRSFDLALPHLPRTDRSRASARRVAKKPAQTQTG
jgi:pimeloyl-ACP methyl ester carboxylesterase